MNSNRPLPQSLKLSAASALVLLIVQPGLAHAYVGPAATVSFFGAAFGLIAAVVSALGVVLLWPLRIFARFVRRLVTSMKRRSSMRRTSN